MVDGDTKAEVVRRLNRIEGQVRGLKQMVEDERYCVDVLTQIAAVRTALERVGLELLDGHVRHCIGGALEAGDGDTASAHSEEMLAAIQRFVATR